MQSSQYPRLELKYCERCGGLWLRPQLAETVYCASCAEAMRELPPVGGGTPSGAVQAAYGAVLTFCTTAAGIAECLGGACA